MTDRDRLFFDALTAPTPAIAYTLSDLLAKRWPDRYILETEDSDIDVDIFLSRVPCEVQLHPSPHPQSDTSWLGQERKLSEHVIQGHRSITWEGETFEVITSSWTDGRCSHNRVAITGRSRVVVEQLATKIALITSEVRDDEVMVFADGYWQRSQELRAAIRGATFDNLVLPSGVAESILSDFRQFLGARAEYERYGVAWKRGALFLGPPGNGKTHCVKALLNALGVPCLYVQSFESKYTNPQHNVHTVFERARRTTPCALVLEDLDSLVTKKTRSFFLNELDGFASNTGILTIATTNHADQLDPAILDRPSRFDRKYHFTLPGFRERLAYLQTWSRASRDEARLADSALEALSGATEGFSYAYLKELVLSALVRWISDARTAPLSEVLAGQVGSLREQMQSALGEKTVRQRYVEQDDDEDDED